MHRRRDDPPDAIVELDGEAVRRRGLVGGIQIIRPVEESDVCACGQTEFLADELAVPLGSPNSSVFGSLGTSNGPKPLAVPLRTPLISAVAVSSNSFGTR